MVGANLPGSFARPAAYGDFATGILAILALLTVRIRPLFNLVGAADLLLAYFHAIRANLPAMAGQRSATYVIPVLYVPMLVITHVVAIYWLLSPRFQEVQATHASTALHPLP